MLKQVIKKFNLIIFIFKSRGYNFDKFISGGLHEKHAVASLGLGNYLRIWLKRQKNQENLFYN
jgi:hypothetical protein